MMISCWIVSLGWVKVLCVNRGKEVRSCDGMGWDVKRK